MADYELRRVKSLASVLSHLKPIRAHFGAWRAVDINFRSIEAYIAKRREAGKSDTTINRETQLLGQAAPTPGEAEQGLATNRSAALSHLGVQRCTWSPLVGRWPKPSQGGRDE